jgi:hypothetical protein
MKSTLKILVGKPKGKRAFWDLLGDMILQGIFNEI